MRESQIESYLVARIKSLGGLTRKYTSPNVRGVPDRIVMLDAEIYFIELKAPGKKLRTDQEREHERMRRQGFYPLVISSTEEVDYRFPPKAKK